MVCGLYGWGASVERNLGAARRCVKARLWAMRSRRVRSETVSTETRQRFPKRQRDFLHQIVAARPVAFVGGNQAHHGGSMLAHHAVVLFFEFALFHRRSRRERLDCIFNRHEAVFECIVPEGG